MPAPLPPHILAELLDALHTHRNARRAAEIVGLHPGTAWRIARRQKIELISLSEHMKKRRVEPEFMAKQAPAASKAATRRLKKEYA